MSVPVHPPISPSTPAEPAGNGEAGTGISLAGILTLIGIALLVLAPPFRGTRTVNGFPVYNLSVWPWAILFVWSLGNLKTACALLCADRSYFGLVILAVLSTVWSNVPTRTFAFSIELFSLVLLSGMAVHFFGGPRNALKAIGHLLLGAAVLSWMAILFVPEVGIDIQGQWKGVYYHKSLLGLSASIPLLMSMSGLIRFGLGARCLCLIALVPLVVYSRSAIAFGALALGCAVAFFHASRPPHTHRRLLVAGLVGILGVLVTIRPSHFSRAERYLFTLNGRLAKWEALMEKSYKKPVLGFGYEAFWARDKRSARVLRQAGLNSEDPKQYYSDNGLLDVYVSTGLVGLGLMLGSLFSYIQRAWRDSDSLGVWTRSFFVYCFAFNMLYGGFLGGRSILVPLYVISAVSLGIRQPNPARVAEPANATAA